VHLYFRCIAEHQEKLTALKQRIKKMTCFYFFLYYPLCFNLIPARLKVIIKFKKVHQDKEVHGIFRCSQAHTPLQIQDRFRNRCSLFQLDPQRRLF